MALIRYSSDQNWSATMCGYPVQDLVCGLWRMSSGPVARRDVGVGVGVDVDVDVNVGARRPDIACADEIRREENSSLRANVTGPSLFDFGEGLKTFG